MSTSVVLFNNLMVFNSSLCTSVNRKSSNFSPNLRVLKCCNGVRNDRILGLVVTSAKRRKKKNKKGHNSKKSSWWKRFFFEEDGNWFGFREEDLEEDVIENNDDSSSSLSEDEVKFEAWKKRAEAIVELREAQEGMRNEENRNWDDWLVFDEGNGGVKREEWSDYDDFEDGGDNVGGLREEDVEGDPEELFPERGLVETVRDFLVGKEEDDLLYEDRVFRYASSNSVLASCYTDVI